ncbi:threonylcarbamoyl-AMP synthase [Candidatus Berkiella cookevillensis]|uniref:Threonylcarbamoyl-AMP synthase n=1 Tax=Candidatus Berkiella cookevillensis TaxID=437022 RepID=A0A0Q9YM09_9GAMM|nr:L-threonylcarbamoyladenylate synthase [Candidatus Berkiella cookevillensis]MCS5709137.1 threonylcarbamoyl-AMP synthase [Candidatus Berkiella cookevillensis]
MKLILNPDEIVVAANVLKSGHVIAIPTETVYGLAADITQEQALRQIFALKHRPTEHPLIIHIAKDMNLSDYAVNIPDYVQALTKAFWPGPLTLILEKSNKVSYWVTGGQDTVGIRMPNHPVALALIEQVGAPLAAPSANQFGKVSPTSSQHVLDEFGTSVRVLEGGECMVGIESTILDATEPTQCRILRPGMITIEDIQKVVGDRVLVTVGSKQSPQVSGSLKYHYEPSKPTYLYENEQELAFLQALYSAELCILAQATNTNESVECLQWIQMPTTVEQYAQKLYESLRRADQSSCQAIAIQAPSRAVLWNGIWDRLLKSTAKSQHHLKEMNHAMMADIPS